jgi:hypothetical protein
VSADTLRNREARLAELVGAVARQCLADRGRARVALLDDGGPEARLAARLLAAALGEAAVVRVQVGETDVEPLLHLAGGAPAGQIRAETLRLRARLVPDAVVANPAGKTALLLGGDLPPEPLLPLGDLYASEVAALAGGWSAPDEVRTIAELAGGVEALDEALRRWIDGRDPGGLGALSPEAAGAVRAAFARGRASRLHPRVVPKLGRRTLCVDLFE